MPANENQKLLRLSQRWYQRLLRAYPQSHRAEYGDAMAQLFNDQCRDAWRDGRRRGLLLLWLRILPDLLKTSFLEHLDNLKGKKVMTNKISAGTRSPSAALTAFFVVFFIVFGLVLMTGTIITFIMPKQYASEAGVFLKVIRTQGTLQNQSIGGLTQTECEAIKSEHILDKVIDQLDLNSDWSKKYGVISKFKTSETRQALKRMIDVRPIGAPVIQIKVYSDDPSEATRIINCVIENYLVYHQEAEAASDLQTKGINFRVSIIEAATPAILTRPNKPLNIFLSAVIGGIGGVVAGGLSAWIVSRVRHRWGKSPPPTPVIQSTY